jgi:hypothetical protein|tara:strand:+ start:451 stop:579 length:129 start_codon:yes stop_codon:yes gene_type:complete
MLKCKIFDTTDENAISSFLDSNNYTELLTTSDKIIIIYDEEV